MSGRYVVGWVTAKEWARGDGDFDMNFEGSGYLTSDLARKHACGIAQQNPEWTFIVMDDEAQAFDEVIIYAVSRDRRLVGGVRSLSV